MCLIFGLLYQNFGGGEGAHSSPSQHPEEAGSRFLRKVIIIIIIIIMFIDFKWVDTRWQWSFNMLHMHGIWRLII